MQLPTAAGGPRSPRVTAVDGLRGLLAVVVVAWHVADPFRIDWMLIPAKAAVVVFFVLSGYVLTRGWDGRMGIFMVRRFIRLWPVFALCLGAGFLIAGVTPVWSQFLWYPLIHADDRPAIDPPAWSLFLEVWTMPLMPLIIWTRSSLLWRGLPVATAFLLASIANPILQVPAYFIVGAALAHVEFRGRLLEGPIPQWLGRISYSLYLSHALVIALAVRTFGPWGGVAALPAVFAVGWLIWRLVERPSIALSRWAGHALAHVLAAPRQGPEPAAPPA